jgi:hypothetical protein
MSAIPAFSFTTTADEVATAFSQEIKGKNGTVPSFRLVKDIQSDR